MAENENDNRSGLIGFLWREVRGFFEEMFVNVWTGFLDIIPHTVDRVKNSMIDAIYVSIDEWKNMTNYYRELGMLDEKSARNVETFQRLAWPLDVFMHWYTHFILNKNYLDNYSYAVTAEMRHKLAGRRIYRTGKNQ